MAIRQLTISMPGGPKSILTITPKDTTWPTWVETAERYRLEDEELVRVDIGPKDIQLSFKELGN